MLVVENVRLPDKPVPERFAVCVLPATPLELSVTVSVADLLPVAVGANVTQILQELPVVGGKTCPAEHGLAPVPKGKSREFAPLMANPEMVSDPALAPVAVLVTVNAWAALGVAGEVTPPFANVNGEGPKLAVPTVPVPVIIRV